MKQFNYCRIFLFCLMYFDWSLAGKGITADNGLFFQMWNYVFMKSDLVQNVGAESIPYVMENIITKLYHKYIMHNVNSVCIGLKSCMFGCT